MGTNYLKLLWKRLGSVGLALDISWPRLVSGLQLHSLMLHYASLASISTMINPIATDTQRQKVCAFIIQRLKWVGTRGNGVPIALEILA